MTETVAQNRKLQTVTLWLDPVCPFSWNTARWLTAAAEQAGFEIDWQFMNLAVLNSGRELAPPLQARMNDSRQIGRLMTALSNELGPGIARRAYIAFAQQYFDYSTAVDEELVAHIAQVVGSRHVSAAALNDASLDGAVAESHQRSQDALGETGGSPLLSIDGNTVFGPVFTAVPADHETMVVFDAVTALIHTPQFSQLQRPRTH